jgi:hypothetical protein
MDSERPTNPSPDEEGNWIVITTVAQIVVRAKTPQEARETVERRGFTVIEVKRYDDG